MPTRENNKKSHWAVRNTEMKKMVCGFYAKYIWECKGQETHSANVGLMLAHHLRRWANTKPHWLSVPYQLVAWLVSRHQVGDEVAVFDTPQPGHQPNPLLRDAPFDIWGGGAEKNWKK